jgi:hypothetical protein
MRVISPKRAIKVPTMRETCATDFPGSSFVWTTRDVSTGSGVQASPTRRTCGRGAR